MPRIGWRLKESVTRRPSHLPAPNAARAASAQAEDFRLEDWPFYWVSRVVGRYQDQLQVALKKHGLDVPRWRVLMSLHGQANASVSELSEHAIVKLPTMTKIVQRMELDGLVVARPRETDGRVTEVTLTPLGIEASRVAWTEAMAIYADTFEGVSARDVKKLNALMISLFTNLG